LVAIGLKQRAFRGEVTCVALAPGQDQIVLPYRADG
jgi:hypothetical protein